VLGSVSRAKAAIAFVLFVRSLSPEKEKRKMAESKGKESDLAISDVKEVAVGGGEFDPVYEAKAQVLNEAASSATQSYLVGSLADFCVSCRSKKSAGVAVRVRSLHPESLTELTIFLRPELSLCRSGLWLVRRQLLAARHFSPNSWSDPRARY
jgi:hypothetical protein